jgi:hypothetical protein
MANVENVLGTRFANALFSDASVSPHALAAVGQLLDRTLTNAQPYPLGPFMSRLLPTILSKELDWFKGQQGGLWVGGKAILTPMALIFSPNGMNEAMHSWPEHLKWTVPIEQITALQVRSALITDIIDINSQSGRLSLRCFKAKAFSTRIEQARDASRRDSSGRT